jgi:hypothetical protein
MFACFLGGQAGFLVVVVVVLVGFGRGRGFVLVGGWGFRGGLGTDPNPWGDVSQCRWKRPLPLHRHGCELLSK